MRNYAEGEPVPAPRKPKTRRPEGVFKELAKKKEPIGTRYAPGKMASPLSDEELDALVNQMVHFFESDVRNITMVQFNSHIGVSRSGLDDLISKYPKIADAVEYCKGVMESNMVYLGVDARNGVAFPIFSLKARAGWVEKGVEDAKIEHNIVYNVIRKEGDE